MVRAFVKVPQFIVNAAPELEFGIPPPKRGTKAIRRVFLEPLRAVGWFEIGDPVHEVGHAGVVVMRDLRTPFVPPFILIGALTSKAIPDTV